MNITNGTVSRTVQVAQYEPRVITLTFTCDPGDDIDAGLAYVAALAEKHARRAADPVPGSAPPVTVAKREVPPTPRTAATPSTAAPTPNSANPPADAAPPPVSAPSGPPPATPGPLTTQSASEPITDDELTKACQAATARAHSPAPTHECVARFVDPAEPQKKARMIPQEKRAAFLEALALVGATPEY